MFRLNVDTSTLVELLEQISIHLMFRLNQEKGQKLLLLLKNFNTSNVSVEPQPEPLSFALLLHFNTSNVSVEPSPL